MTKQRRAVQRTAAAVRRRLPDRRPYSTHRVIALNDNGTVTLDGIAVPAWCIGSYAPVLEDIALVLDPDGIPRVVGRMGPSRFVGRSTGNVGTAGAPLAPSIVHPVTLDDSAAVTAPRDGLYRATTEFLHGGGTSTEWYFYQRFGLGGTVHSHGPVSGNTARRDFTAVNFIVAAAGEIVAPLVYWTVANNYCDAQTTVEEMPLSS